MVVAPCAAIYPHEGYVSLVAKRYATSACPLRLNSRISHCVPITPVLICPLFVVIMVVTAFLATSLMYGLGTRPKANGKIFAVTVLLP